MIRGNKNWLPPSQLVYGFGFLFKYDDTDSESCARHKGERSPWLRGGELEEEMENQGISNQLNTLEVADESDDEEVSVGNVVVGKKELGVTAPHGVDESSDDASVDQEKVKGAEDGEEAEEEEAEEEDEDEEEEMDFPDTQLDFPDTEGAVDLSSLVAEARATAHANKKTGRRTISAKERREFLKQRKGGNPQQKTETDLPESASPPVSISGSDRDEPVVTNAVSSNGPKVKGATAIPPPPQVRGKKGKLKKIKEKYKFQDEDEREIMLELLGSRGKPEEPLDDTRKKGSKKDKKNEKKNEKKGGKHAQESTTKSSSGHKTNFAEKQSIFIKHSPDVSITGVASTTIEATRAPPTAFPSDQCSANLVKRDEILYEVDDREIPPELTDFSYLDSLTGQPHGSDTLLFALPMCAPFTTLAKYKHKAKLIPGSLKRGKAARSICSVFGAIRRDDDEATKRERELIRLVKEEEVVAQVLGKVKIMGMEDKFKGKKGSKSGRRK